ncbi:MAG: hypothetical protein WC184_11305 [Acidimicrobiia bacterium]
MGLAKIVQNISATEVLQLVLRVLGDNPKIVEAVAKNPHTTLRVVESAWPRFNTVGEATRLIENTNDPAVANRILGGNHNAQAVLFAGLENWFLPAELYKTVIRRLSSYGLLCVLDGYPKTLKSELAQDHVSRDSRDWVAWDITAFSDETLVTALQNKILSQQLKRSGIEAVVFHKIELLDQLGVNISPAIADVAAGFPLPEQVVENILVAAKTNGSLTQGYKTALVGLAAQPWLSVELHTQTKTLLEQHFGIKTTEDTPSFQGQLGGITNPQNVDEAVEFLTRSHKHASLIRRLIVEALTSPHLYTHPEIKKWLLNPGIPGFFSKGQAAWFPENVTQTLRGIVAEGMNYDPDHHNSPMSWDYRKNVKYLSGSSTWSLDLIGRPRYQTLDPVDVPVRRKPSKSLNVGKQPNLLPKALVSSLSVQALFKPDTDPTVYPGLVAWFLEQLGPGDTPESLAVWEVFLRLLPEWDRTLEDLVTATKKLVKV